MIRRTPIKKKRTKARRGPLRDPEYRAYVRSLVCLLSMRSRINPDVMFCTGTADAAHTQNNGMGSKGDDSSCVPLCRRHHCEYDAGRTAFEKKYGLDMKAIAAELWALYQQECEA